ncbi:hypothetical protein GCM10010912_14420 [Paenibacillus albidus]|uniref:Rhodanese domain-containing protein n=1 Tax=Paenibacillus albidus TaxID=2041023 RepID=A0A917C3D9_9BACL|nr:rhodanese-like domain-containing protein [Paenibacillus albidus]GGF70376.1 hypothetical protein GCM10010912_14420 [Paenibacillus albidus]
MTMVYILTGLFGLWLLIQLWPLRALTFIRSEEWDPFRKRWENVKILDVRDASEYSIRHIPGSINISIGRLPFLWSKNLAPNDEVIIFSSSWVQGKKAARILARRGFQDLYAVRSCYLTMTIGDISNNNDYRSGYCK